MLDTCKRLEKHGYRVTYLPVQKDGLIDLDELKRAMTDKTILVTIMAANNEIGSRAADSRKSASSAASGACCSTPTPLQAVGKVPVNVMKTMIDLDVDLGAQDLRAEGRGRAVCAQQESARAADRADGWRRPRARHAQRHPERDRHRRPGQGLRDRAARMAEESCRLAGLRDRLRDKIMAALDEVYINGSMEHRLPGNLNISFAYVEGESLLMGISDVAVSSGSACTSATLEPCYVLKALGAGDELAHSSIRFGLGRFNTEAEVDYVARAGRRDRAAPARTFAAVRDGERRRGSHQGRSGRSSDS